MRKKKNKAGLTGKAKRFAALALAGCMLYCGGVQANAATLKDVFDEHYYADQYPDLKEVYGYDREALWQHFTTHGLSEGRNMNGLIDIVKYREMYSDLDAAFGDNWNAYLNHYLTFGAKENRETGTDSNFNALDYAGRYEDLQAAYGTNVLALWNHYRAFGATEGREARDEAVVQAEREAEQAEEEESDIEETEADSSQARTERREYADGGWGIYEYNSIGKLIKRTIYSSNGVIYKMNEYDSTGMPVKETFYDQFGHVGDWITYEVEKYDNGNKKKVVGYRSDGDKDVSEYDSTGNLVKSIHYFASGARQELIYDNGKVIKKIQANSDGSYAVIEQDSNGNQIVTSYDKDGNIIN